MLRKLNTEIKACAICSEHLALGPRPVFTAHKKSKIVIVGQAPGLAVHKSGIPWNDKSGNNLRKWMNVDNNTFYDTKQIAIIPMGFCYPGKGKSGDLAPRKECAPKWHLALLNEMPNVQLILLIGKYAQDYYIKNNPYKNLTETVKNYQNFLPNYFVLPHPSPRNNIWQAKNEWFSKDVLPDLKYTIKNILAL
ncbi:MAG: uracil-DNA glycosylase family protein [Chitinophagales bacterium]